VYSYYCVVSLGCLIFRCFALLCAVYNSTASFSPPVLSSSWSKHPKGDLFSLSYCSHSSPGLPITTDTARILHSIPFLTEKKEILAKMSALTTSPTTVPTRVPQFGPLRPQAQCQPACTCRCADKWLINPIRHRHRADVDRLNLPRIENDLQFVHRVRASSSSTRTSIIHPRHPRCGTLWLRVVTHVRSMVTVPQPSLNNR
jgi:hypothetical protein